MFLEAPGFQEQKFYFLILQKKILLYFLLSADPIAHRSPMAKVCREAACSGFP